MALKREGLGEEFLEYLLELGRNRSANSAQAKKVYEEAEELLRGVYK
jgi:hypothetical protein